MCHKYDSVLNCRRDCDPYITALERELTGRAWVSGIIGPHQFQALVFPEHAANSEWEFGQSRISKLWVRRLQSGETVYNWDRGLDVPADTQAVHEVVNRLMEFLSPHLFGIVVCEQQAERAK